MGADGVLKVGQGDRGGGIVHVPIIAILGATGIVLSACYSLFLYNRLSYGSYSPHLPILKDINRREYSLLISLLLPTIIFGIIPNVLLNPLHITTSALLYNF